MHFSKERFRLRTALVGAGTLVIVLITLVSFMYYSYTVTNTKEIAQQMVAQTAAQFENVTTLTSAELQALRTYRNQEHVDRAQTLGISGIEDREDAGRLAAQDKLVPLESNPFYHVREMDFSVPYVTEDTANLLKLIGLRFHEALAAGELPPYKYVITSATRTRQDQKRLQGVNVNAAAKSSHEFGTTVDLHYADFAYAPSRHALPVEGAFGVSLALLKNLVAQEYERMAEEQHEALKAILGRVLSELQQEGKVLVIYERLQPVYHITLGEELTDPDPKVSTAPDTAAIAVEPPAAPAAATIAR